MPINLKNVGDIIKVIQIVSFVVPSAPGKRFKDDIKVTDLLSKHIMQKVNKNLNVLLIQSKIVIKVLSMNLI